MVSRRSDRSLRRCECPTTHTGRVIRRKIVRACLKIAWGPAARDFGCGQGGEAGASPQRAVTAEPTKATGKRPAARRVFEEKAGWLRCSSVGDRCGYPPSSRLAIRPFPRKQDSHGIFRQALKGLTALVFFGLLCSQAFGKPSGSKPKAGTKSGSSDYVFTNDSVVRI